MQPEIPFISTWRILRIDKRRCKSVYRFSALIYDLATSFPSQNYVQNKDNWVLETQKSKFKTNY